MTEQGDTGSPPAAQDGTPTSPRTDAVRMECVVDDHVLPLDLVSAFAGDRPMTDAEQALIDHVRTRHGDGFFPALLYAVTHQSFPPSRAEEIWQAILRHKYEMSATLQRNIRITVASLDYLSNLTGTLQSATVIDETRVADMIRLTQRDGLTQLLNHTSCYQKLTEEMKRHSRYGSPLSVMMIDIDDFKVINDRHGHPAGDRVLAALGVLIAKAVRETDICCRYGGEEFLIILPSTGAREAVVLAERLRASLQADLPGGLKTTVSIGVAECDGSIGTAQALVERADAALYDAKRSGKNRVSVSAAGRE